MWTVEEASYFLGVPIKTLYQWKWAGGGPPVKKVGRHLRYNPARLRAWADQDEAA
ncbi:helix-turn-helix domain-containing protein [Nocardia sp. R16R-3T]